MCLFSVSRKWKKNFAGSINYFLKKLNQQIIDLKKKTVKQGKTTFYLLIYVFKTKYNQQTKHVNCLTTEFKELCSF